MSLSLNATYTALGAGLTSSFLGSGGTSPYSYEVASGGAGGTIDSSTGLYTAPSSVPPSANYAYDIVSVVDDDSAVASLNILVGSPLILFCDVIETSMGLDSGRVYLWDQKIFEPLDYYLYIAVSVASCKPFSNQKVYEYTDGIYYEVQCVNIFNVVNLDLISRGPDALIRKEEAILALNSIYSEQQQEANSFKIGSISSNFVNLSRLDASAIPFRFRISCGLQYFTSKTSAVSYIDDFQTTSLATEA